MPNRTQSLDIDPDGVGSVCRYSVVLLGVMYLLLHCYGGSVEVYRRVDNWPTLMPPRLDSLKGAYATGHP